MKRKSADAGLGGLGMERGPATEFVRGAVHDLRASLRAIRAHCEILEAGLAAPDPPDLNQNLRFIREGADCLETLIRDLAEFCHEQLRVPEPSAVDLGLVLSEIKQTLARELQNAAAVITQDSLPVIRGDSVGWAMVLRILVANACKFRGPDPLAIHIGAEKRRGSWILSVRDNGIGFEPAYRDLIFQPFERLHGKGYPGSGLGLTLAKLIVERQGGRIWAEGIRGQGSTFFVSVPAVTRRAVPAAG